MKYSISHISATALLVVALSAGEALAQGTPVSKTTFTTAVNKYKAHIAAGQATQAEAELKTLMELMRQHSRDEQQAYTDATSNDQRHTINQRLVKEKTIYTEVHKLSRNGGNSTAIKTKLDQYANTF